MTRARYAGCVTPEELRRQAERLLWRYVVEVVEPFGLCPWARRARERGEVRVEVLLDAAPAAVLAAVGRIADAAPIGMVVLPRAPLDLRALRRLRDEVVAARAGVAPAVGVAEFHPDAPLDLSSAARAVAGLRRAPDPTLQVVRLDVLAAARAAAPAPDLTVQAAILAGRAAPPPPPVADRIADGNLRTATAARARLEAALADIHADRARSY